jgi:hypothetical protein
MVSEGRLRTHCLVRRRLSAAYEVLARSSMQQLLTQQAADTGATFIRPSSFSIIISATGVPRRVGHAVAVDRYCER